jgi:hypothetical protein
MTHLVEKIKSISKVQIFAIVLIMVGLAIMVPKAKGMFDFYKEVQYAKEHNFAAGNLSPDLLRPWMSIRYIAVAYAIPQKYLFDAAHIQPKKETSMIGLNRLNQQMRLGQVDGQLALLKTMRNAIVEYRAHPVVMGLLEKQVEDWMTVQYIANSSGIPAESIFQQINIPADGNAYKPLGFLSDEVNYSGGPKALIAAIQKIVDAQGVKPVTP